MKLQSTVPAQPATAEPLTEQALMEASTAQAAGQTAPGEALREALASRSAGEGSSRSARRSGMSVLRSIAGTSHGGTSHASPRTQTLVMRQSADVQIQDDGTEESIALPQELDGAIANWASNAVDHATVATADDTQLLPHTSHLRVSRDGRRQRPRGQPHQPSQEQPQDQSKQEASAAADQTSDGEQAAHTRTEGLADQALVGGHAPQPGSTAESPWPPPSGARSTTRVAPLAAAAAQRQVAKLDSKLAAGKSNSDVVAALMWALAAMVVVIVATLLLALFTEDTHEPVSEPAVVQPDPPEAPSRAQATGAGQFNEHRTSDREPSA